MANIISDIAFTFAVLDERRKKKKQREQARYLYLYADVCIVISGSLDIDYICFLTLKEYNETSESIGEYISQYLGYYAANTSVLTAYKLKDELEVDLKLMHWNDVLRLTTKRIEWFYGHDLGVKFFEDIVF